MKNSGFRSMYHIYLLFFLSLLGTVIMAAILSFFLITVQKPDGSLARSDWPKTFTENFGEQIIFHKKIPRIKQSGLKLLEKYKTGIQILDDTGQEVFRYQCPASTKTGYSSSALLQLYQSGLTGNDTSTSLIGFVHNQNSEYTYLLHFPVKIQKVTMYLNGSNFTDGKTMIFLFLGILFLIILVCGITYGFWMARTMGSLTAAVKDISKRRYLPVSDHGAFGAVYTSLNTLDSEIKASDRMREQTQKMQEEWIANITHDLKTPLSPIRGYGEILSEDSTKDAAQCKKYGQVITRNVAYMESLIDDLKLTYQLENGMVPIHPQRQNLIRFLKELVIDILNAPEYENRCIHFETEKESLFFSFDPKLFRRAFQNLIVNAFVHGEKDTEITLKISASDTLLKIMVSDNGKGILPEDRDTLFKRYWRGTNTGQKPEGTGLGLAIAQSIAELHNGSISVSGIPGTGTTFQICLPAD